MTEELKPCPFCGGEAFWMISTETAMAQTFGEESKKNTVACEECGCTTPEWYSKEKAIKAWNTRA